MNAISGVTKFDQKLQDLLNKYRGDLKLNIFLDEDTEAWLNLSRDQIQNMDEKSALSVAASLIRHSIVIQQEYNRENAIVQWCDSQINALSSKYWSNYDKFLPKEIRIPMIAQENPTIQQLVEIRDIALSRANEISHISGLIKYYSSIYYEIGKKNGYRRNFE